MDIVIPSNFERFLFWLFGNDPVKLTSVMRVCSRLGCLQWRGNMHGMTACNGGVPW